MKSKQTRGRWRFAIRRRSSMLTALSMFMAPDLGKCRAGEPAAIPLPLRESEGPAAKQREGEGAVPSLDRLPSRAYSASRKCHTSIAGRPPRLRMTCCGGRVAAKRRSSALPGKVTVSVTAFQSSTAAASTMRSEGVR